MDANDLVMVAWYGCWAFLLAIKIYELYFRPAPMTELTYVPYLRSLR